MSGSASEVAQIDHGLYLKSTIVPLQKRYAKYLDQIVVPYLLAVMKLEQKERARRERRIVILAAILGAVMAVLMVLA